MTHYEIIKKLIGPIQPLGDSSRDAERLENQKAMQTILWQLLDDVQRVSYEAQSHEHSVQVAGALASSFLSDVRERIGG